MSKIAYIIILCVLALTLGLSLGLIIVGFMKGYPFVVIWNVLNAIGVVFVMAVANRVRQK